ncbi:peptidase, S9A/B/C family, catalytic domain protein [Necator americanus]|uniref:Peptidase, S9A/B/C family, catalytic domain protein n=1 Tax=Necator americanus TaxID=51031 RepID=W2T1T6_NECAM|nr:peptidase, S9A/B/C family, catalytic domain protein [Necator americanus]ETN75960.1 peptidase, S9A/B/C family, catalytic domain protein [Necator americanus]
MLLAVLLLPLVSADLIPRELLFSDPKYSSISLSPNGRFFAYIAPDENKVKNVFVKCTSCKSTRQVTFEESSDVLGYSWTGVHDVILYTQDRNGDENTMLFKKNISEADLALDRNKRAVISNRPGVKAIVMGNNHKDSRILIGLNDENPVYHNIYIFDLLTDTMTPHLKNSRFPVFVVDNDLNVRLAAEEQPDGSLMYYRLSAKAQAPLSSDPSLWEQYLLVQPDDRAITMPVSFDKSNQYMYWLWGDDNIDLGTLVLFKFDDPEHKEVLYTATRAQIGSILIHPTDKTVLAVTEIYHKPELFVANGTVMDDLQYLVNLRPHGSLQILSLSLDMTTWLVTYLSSDKPYEVFLYRSWVKTAEFLFNVRPELEQYKLNKQVGFDFKTRDDMVLQAYISLPPEAPLRSPKDVPEADQGYAKLGMLPVEPQKMIVLVHGGPKARDDYGFSATNAWLTSRGYAVLQVNFRGSVGFGKRLTNAGDGEWGRKMHFDILDSVEFAVAKGIANRSEVAIMGGSYGGYETLAALTFTPDEFACGVDIVGPSNLVSLIQAVPPYWRGFYKDLVRMMGADIDTDEGRQSLTARSPLFFAERVTKPLMILQGANDPRVKQQESDQFVAALRKKNIPVSYILYPDEGHGFRKANNRLAQCGFIEKFLHSCLGGEYEPFEQGQYNSSAIMKSDGFPTTIESRPPTPPPYPTLAPQLFYRPILPRFAARALPLPTDFPPSPTVLLRGLPFNHR